MGLSASDAASAANELIAQIEAEASASQGLADTSVTTASAFGGLSTVISEAATSTTTLSSSLSGFASEASSTADSLRKAVGSFEEAVSSSGSRSADSGVSGQFHSGGLIPYDGTFYLQKGEVVVPKNQASNSGQQQTIVINIAGTTVAQVLAPMIDAQVTAQSRRGMLGVRTAY